MNEAQFRDQLHKAVGDAKYPAYLASRVESHLAASAQRSAAGAFARPGWLPGLGTASSLVAALLVALLVAALVVGVRAWRDGELFRTGPATPTIHDPSVKLTRQYQAMIGADSQRVISSQSNNCASLADACPTGAGAVISALQQWLDDLDTTRPPAKFAYVEAQMRRHIVLAIASLNAAIAAYNAKDQAGMDNAINTAVNERDAIETEVNAVVGSKPASIAGYKATVRSDSANLLGCTACQPLLSQNQMSCTASQIRSCLDEIAAARFQLEVFQGDLVLDFAPDSLAAEDAYLQADLSAADVALGVTEAALSAGDHARFESGHTALRQALDRVASDVANIALTN